MTARDPEAFTERDSRAKQLLDEAHLLIAAAQLARANGDAAASLEIAMEAALRLKAVRALENLAKVAAECRR